MLYTRREIVELCAEYGGSELAPLLVSLIWHTSKGNPNLQVGDRYGLTQVSLKQVNLLLGVTVPNSLLVNNLANAGLRRKNSEDIDFPGKFSGNPADLLLPPININTAAILLRNATLVEFCGREFAPQIPSILGLANFLATSRDGPRDGPTR
jgi:hypothetical protein